jgi:hypothetical protein
MKTQKVRRPGNEPRYGDELLHACIAAQRKGADFPTVWNNVLKGSGLVRGPPVQLVHEGRAMLEVTLITGQVIVFGPWGYSMR